MPKYFVETVLSYLVEADDPQHAWDIIEDGGVSRRDPEEAYISAVFAEDNITQLLPAPKETGLFKLFEGSKPWEGMNDAQTKSSNT